MENKKFEEYTKNLNLKKIHTGSVWTEGPCYLKRLNKVIWSDIPNNRMLSFDFKKVEIFRSPSNFLFSILIKYYLFLYSTKKLCFLLVYNQRRSI